MVERGINISPSGQFSQESSSVGVWGEGDISSNEWNEKGGRGRGASPGGSSYATKMVPAEAALGSIVAPSELRPPMMRTKSAGLIVAAGSAYVVQGPPLMSE